MTPLGDLPLASQARRRANRRRGGYGGHFRAAQGFRYYGQKGLLNNRLFRHPGQADADARGEIVIWRPVRLDVRADNRAEDQGLQQVPGRRLLC